MGLYGMTNGQALGRGTFTFDRIVPNRYLLDSRVNNDSVMPGRYALIEYDRPIAVIKNVELILNTADNKYELPNDFSFKYNIENKTYDIIPVCEENRKISMVIPDRNIISDLLDNDTTGKIDKFINKQAEEEDLSELGLTEVEIEKLYKYRYAIQTKGKIFICVQTPNQEITYNYFYANIPEQSSALLTKANFTLYEPNKPDQDGKEYEYNPLTPNEFNKIVDKAYVAKDTTDDIDLNTFELWDSTAWIKVIDKEKSEFKYIKIADLNVLTPTFKVLTNSEEDQNIIGLIDTFSSYDNTQPKPIAIFNVPQIKQAENGIFNIRCPNPMDINIAIDTSSDSTGNTVDSVSSQYIDKNTKKFTLNLPSIGNAVIDANEAISEANEATSEANAAASEANSAASAANRAANDANAAASNVGDNIKNVFSSGQVTVDWSISKPQSDGANVKIPIAEKPTIISANDIVTFWDQNS